MSEPDPHEEASDLSASPAPVSRNLGDQAQAFRAAAAFLESRRGPPADRETFGVREKAALQDWAGQNGGLIPPAIFAGLELVSNSTSEHQVYYRASDNRAIKRTWAGVYGQVPFASQRLDRRNALPSEYLHRMALQIEVFDSDIRLEGVSISEEPSMIIGAPSREPSLVISQEWFESEGAPAWEAILARLAREGFRHDPDAYFGFYRLADGVVLVDAKPDNWMEIGSSVIPFDLQLAQFSIEDMQRCGRGSST